MARIVDEAEHRAKREAILDFAAELVRTKGYERMTVQDVLDGIGISRGAFYHYFDSKESLLDGLVGRMGSDAVETLLPIVRDPRLTALQKFHRHVEASSRLKASRPELIIGVLRTWYSDENILLRRKLTDAVLNYTAPLILEPIIRQGIAEKTFDTPYPQLAARIIVGISLSMVDSTVGLLFSDDPDQSVAQRVREVMDAYTDSTERILGAPPGSLRNEQVDQLLSVSLRTRVAQLARQGRTDDTR
ncbi:MAG TPA: TetR/AcrR family transcriptional regulator [Amycolatopsis sp.]|nr:TetR/AcrR family transcriptional regulator [Amycolatopsis sp.]HKS48690.1 TetR/AcrR family transcriptional regulator [Amycolatopsis sp.]